MSLKIRVITPDRIVWNTSADEVILPSTSGNLGILTSHVPLITSLDIGILRIKSGANWTPIVVLGWFAEVEDNEVTVLVNGVDEVASEDIDLAKAELEQASSKLENAQTDKEKIEASINLKRVSSRIKAMAFL